ncbi:hypothetical protein OF001_U230050 [Pseudomonas sp. OF001]|nr:hypothetical protein OF001_U230050 [Pseudomonas sp. OF001]
MTPQRLHDYANQNKLTQITKSTPDAYARTTYPRRSRLPGGLRQRVRQRGAARRPAGRPELAAEGALRPVCRAAVRHRLHRAAQRGAAYLDVPHPPVRRPRPLRAPGAADRRQPPRPGQPQPPALEPAGDPAGADRLRRRPGRPGRQRPRRIHQRHQRLPVRRQRLDAAGVLRRRRRAADRPAGRAPAHRQRAGPLGRRAAGDRGDPAWPEVPRRAAG